MFKLMVCRRGMYFRTVDTYVLENLTEGQLANEICLFRTGDAIKPASEQATLWKAH